jgi:hypothetical protein
MKEVSTEKSGEALATSSFARYRGISAPFDAFTY